ncbi:ROK family protein [Streptomyces sp. RFCAC02]|uniref:ROK family protein n=1 Tax=Streptomyces sp. RFCAC02 TaxID=2499143 RepID=UPI00101EB3E0|nr:ROK family protein [Streptomyces sp. RFCAC02]
MTRTEDAQDHVIALDVGGTAIKAALYDPGFRPLVEIRRPTGDPAGAVDTVLGVAAELYDAAVTRLGRPPSAAGVCVPGLVDAAAGIAVWSANLGWRDVPLRRLLTDRLDGLPVAIGHDLRTAGLAEARLGAGAGRSRFLLVALGTGIAGAIGIDGVIEAGAHGGAGEIGHLIVRPGGALCGCGRRGCLETVASAAAVGRAWAAACGDPAADAAHAARAVAAGDPRAAAVWRTAVDGLADGLLAAVRLLDPGTVLLGGGLAEAGDLLLAPVREALAERIAFQRMPEILPAALGDSAGRLGAALLAHDARPLPLTAEVDAR